MLWFIGFFGFGKLMVVGVLEEVLYKFGVSMYLLDGDNVCYGLCSDFGFSDVDCKENICCVGEVVNLMVEVGLVVLIVFILLYCVEC